MSVLEATTILRGDLPGVSHADAHRRALLIRRVNALYHERTCSAFDGEHGYRHRVEGAFWRRVGAELLSPQGLLRAKAGDRPAQPGLVILDLACGTGFVGRTVRPFLQAGDRLMGLDLGTGMLRLNRESWPHVDGAPTLATMSADAQRLPLADASVDLVAMNAGLHHLPDPNAALTEVDRVLRPGGCFALGFEPHRRHFESSIMRRLTRWLFLAGWYLSPRENLRRLGIRFSSAAGAPNHQDTGDLLESINARLIAEGLIASPLPERRLLDLVDPHARGGGAAAGFDPCELLRNSMPGFELLHLRCSDWLGETARRWRWLAPAADALLPLVLPDRGSLFSWVVRKHGGEVGR